MRIVVPDYVSNSYFPAIAAVELGLFREEGIDASVELHFPVTDAAHALRNGEVDLLAGAAHAPFHAFPDGRGARILASLSHYMYWFLVVRHDLEADSLDDLRDIRMGAAPGPDLGLYQLLADAGIDHSVRSIEIGPIPASGDSRNVSFGVSAARALAEKKIDAFWANGMGAEIATRDGVGRVLVDARRESGPSRHLTFPALICSEEFLKTRADEAAAAIRALVRSQEMLSNDVSLATEVGKRVFPSDEASLIATLIQRDAPFYYADVKPESVEGVRRLAVERGLSKAPASYEELVATELSSLWTSAK